MDTKHQFLSDPIKCVTRECKEAIAPLEVVTPDIFSEIFTKTARKYRVDEKELSQICTDSLRQEVEHYIRLNEKSARQIDSLDATSQKALRAMRENDEKKLRESIEETETLRREIERLKKSAYEDALTRTWNRKWLETNYLDKEGAFKRECVLAIVDLNYFKQINDTLGHIAGDKVLQFISNHLKELKVPVVRYGGDEFVLLFPPDATGDLHARKKMLSCREELLRKKLRFGGRSFKTSFSYGVAEAKEKEPFTDVLQKADRLLYKDKEEIKRSVPPPF